jgi:hypothetical protein
MNGSETTWSTSSHLWSEHMPRSMEGLKRSARLRSESAMQRALAALQRMDASDREINFQTVAAEAGVSNATRALVGATLSTLICLFACETGEISAGCRLTGGPTAADFAPTVQCSVAPARCSVCRLLRVKELHRILHRLPASGACCGLLAVFGEFAGSD